MNHPYFRYLLSILLITACIGVTQAQTNKSSIKKQCSRKLTSSTVLTSVYGIQYRISLCSNMQLLVHAQNTDNKAVRSGLTVRVDRASLYDHELNFSKGESKYIQINAEKSMNVVRNTHHIKVYTYGDYTHFNVTHRFNSTHPVGAPSPYISNVKITNGTIDGKPSAVAKVTIQNPGIQSYSMMLMVNTEGTDGSMYGAAVPPGDQRTITVELLEKRGTKVAGEARLYTGNLSKGNGALDEVEFVGQTKHDTHYWNKSYSPVRAPWQKDTYEYRNDSVDTGGDTTLERVGSALSTTQIIYICAGFVLIVIGVLFRSYRR